MVYSDKVKSRFIVAFVLLITSGLFSLSAVVFEYKPIGVIGAFLLVGSFALFTSWIDLANGEKAKHN